MFGRTRNIESSFRLIRGTCVVVVVGSFLFAGLVYFRAEVSVERAQSRVYILSSGKVLEALAAERKDNVPVEARDHIKMFHWLFFTMDPDEKVIADNLSRALYLADGSALRVSNEMKEQGFYNDIIAGNVTERIVVDSIQLDMVGYPFYFRCYATETITRPSSIATRYLETEGYLRDVSRSDNNPHGFLIERWSVLENRDVKVVAR